jgi:4-hydroxybenzoate polyprenyltransferase
MASSAVYVFNDIIDRNADKQHPEKRNRPIASGSVSIFSAAVVGIICLIIALTGGYIMGPQLAQVIVGYIVLMITYTLLLKNMIIVDVIAISLGFVLRAVAGAIAIGAFVSPWLVICTFALCLFLGFGKRRSEIAIFKEQQTEYRKTLGGYSIELLGHMLNVTSSMAVICFLLYAMDEPTVARIGSWHLVYTTPLVLYCVFRFSAMIQKGKYAGPVEVIIKDRPFQIGFVLWVLACFFVVYAGWFHIDLGISY